MNDFCKLSLNNLVKLIEKKDSLKDIIKSITQLSINLIDKKVPGSSKIATFFANLFEINEATFFNDNTEEEAVKIYKRCVFSQLYIAKLALVDALKNYVTIDESNVKVFDYPLIIENRANEEAKIEDFRLQNDTYRFDNVEYWETIIKRLRGCIQVNDDDYKQLLCEAKERYEAYNTYLTYKSELFHYFIENQSNHSNYMEISKLLDEMNYKISSIKSLYKTVEEFNDCLKSITEPSISLNFFNYGDKGFEEEFKSSLSKDTIYVKAKTRQEVLYYCAYILYSSGDKLARNIWIIDTLDKWNRLRGKCKSKVLIPDFNASVIQPIPDNTNIIAFGEEDFIGNKKPILLEKRILRNMQIALNDDINNFEMSNIIVRESNGLYSVFKRIIFKGINGKPKWEANSSDFLVPALLIGKWSDSSDDINIVGEVSGHQYKNYISDITVLNNKEDPFLLKQSSYNKVFYNLANVEEAWEILFESINVNHINIFKDAIIKVFSDTPPVYGLPIDQHHMGSILAESAKYSGELKHGIIRSLIMLANKDSKPNNFNVVSTQSFVDDIIRELLSVVDTREKWYAISGYLPEIAEASPKAFLDKINNEIKNDETSFWNLFNITGSEMSFGRNYYTYVLWGLEKLITLNDYSVEAMKILADLSIKDITYKISNSPINTLTNSLCGWKHEIGMTVGMKIKMYEYIVKNYTTLCLDIFEKVLPSRTHSQMYWSMHYPKYRNCQRKINILARDEIYDTYREYLIVAIMNANDDLNLWTIIINKSTFFDFKCEKLIFNKILKAYANNTDSELFNFSNTLRDVINRNRKFYKSKWTFTEDQIKSLEENILCKITYENETYNYLHLFTCSNPKILDPIPTYKNDYVTQNKVLVEKRRIEILEYLDFKCLNKLLNLVCDTNESPSSGIKEIAQLYAKIHNHEYKVDFINHSLTLDNYETFLTHYILEIYYTIGFSKSKLVFSNLLQYNSLYLRIISRLDINDSIVEYIEEQDCTICCSFWSSSFLRINNNLKSIELAWKKLKEYKNYEVLIDVYNIYYEKNVEKSIEILLFIKENDGLSELKNRVYDILQIFQFLYSLEYKNEILIDTILQLEVYFLKIRYNIGFKPEVLIEQLSDNPSFYADLLSFAYKKEDIDDEKLLEPDFQKAKWALDILYEFKICPCSYSEYNLTNDNLDIWIHEFIELIKKNGQYGIGMYMLGELLSQSPKGSDGKFPHESIRKVFEDYYNDDLASGFSTGVYNSRGVYVVTDGESEKGLSNNYLNYSKDFIIMYPKLSKILKDISSNYLYESRRDRERATNEL